MNRTTPTFCDYCSTIEGEPALSRSKDRTTVHLHIYQPYIIEKPYTQLVPSHYNATCSAVTGYSPHYLMFGHRPRLLVDFYFPTIGGSEAFTREVSAKHVDNYVASVWERLRTALWEAQAQLTMAACQQKQYYNRKIGTVNLKPGDLVLVKADAFKGNRKIKDRWEEETWEVVHQIMTDVPSYKVTNQHGKSHVLHQN